MKDDYDDDDDDDDDNNNNNNNSSFSHINYGVMIWVRTQFSIIIKRLVP